MTPTGGVAVVTGAGSGVGRQLALALSARGWTVALVGHGRAALEQTAALVDGDARVLVEVVDVADSHEVEAAADHIENQLGPIKVWANVAAVGIFGPVMEAESDDLDRVLAVNVSGVINGSRAAVRRMTARHQGVVINVGSSLAFTSVPHNVLYAASKAAVRSFSTGLGQELHRSGITVAIPHLPAVATPWFAKVRTLRPYLSQPVGPMHDARNVGSALADLAEHPRSGDCYLGLSTRFVVAGTRFAPRLTTAMGARLGARLQKTKLNAPEADNLWEAVEPPPVVPPGFRVFGHKPRWWPPLRIR